MGVTAQQEQSRNARQKMQRPTRDVQITNRTMGIRTCVRAWLCVFRTRDVDTGRTETSLDVLIHIIVYLFCSYYVA